ncbi:hypothetical protein QTL95_21210 [Rhizobium sp. S152]|uniref:hypothetical protein n=1 Tax=Rhizobium sp. S152 TaxID=3055038 RepID=UPI0025A965F0|nr:hypothetical protein [Rhizobium sp. S152]MDM9628420.1 hypothetical protein [Rhizobium sp. S152]
MTATNLNFDFEPDYCQRRILTKGKSYPIAVSPRADECLEDLLIRAACENGFPPYMSYKLMGVSTKIAHRLAPGPNRYGMTPEGLSILLGNPGGPDEVAGLLHDSTPPQPHLKPFFDVWLDWRTLSSHRRVSPLALREAPYLRSIWKVWPIGFDPATKEMLLKKCPECKELLMSGFMGEVWCCDRCNEVTMDGELKAVDLREYPQKIVPETHWSSLDFATSFIDPIARDRRSTSRSLLHADFSDLSDGEVFEVIFAIARLMPSKSAKSARLEITPENLAAAADIVRGWPASFEEHVSEGEVVIAPSKHGLRALLYNSRVSVTLRKRMKEIVRASKLQSTLGPTQSTKLSLSRGPVHEYRNLRKWIKQGASNSDSDEFSDALLLRARTDVRKITAGIGISIPTLMALVDSGFLSSDALDQARRPQLVASAKTLVGGLLNKASLSSVPKGAVRLPRAVAAFFSATDDPWSSVLEAMMQGELEYWCTERAQSSILEGLYIEDLQVLSAVLRRVPQSCRPLNRIPLSFGEAAASTRLHEGGLGFANAAGLIAAPFCWDAIAEFRAKYEPSSLLSVRYIPDIAKAPKIMTKAMQRVLLADDVMPVPIKQAGALTIWHRCEVERVFSSLMMPRVR